ncbi:hypothetical protein [Rhodanobacter sp. FW106-PBR-LB-2-11]|uniref:hypothetical protein n=1 Tax=Rhodanobacter sp. FW106-PBR-LB-2-11 TaxID=1524463 RepID=UPI0034E5C4DC
MSEIYPRRIGFRRIPGPRVECAACDTAQAHRTVRVVSICAPEPTCLEVSVEFTCSYCGFPARRRFRTRFAEGDLTQFALDNASKRWASAESQPLPPRLWTVWDVVALLGAMVAYLALPVDQQSVGMWLVLCLAAMSIRWVLTHLGALK